MTLPTVHGYMAGATVLDRDRMVEISWLLEKVLPLLPDGLDADTVAPLYQLQRDLTDALCPREDADD